MFRWDNINKNYNNEIFIYFTFRKYLAIHPEYLQRTKYYKNIQSLVSNKKLQQELKTHNIKLRIGLHHVLSSKIKINDIGNISIVNDKDIGKIKNSSALLITDYSSMCFDFLYVNKPVIFYRLDENDYTNFTSCDKSNNDNIKSKDKYLFNIFDKEDDVINSIIFYIQNNFELEKEKRLKAEKFFCFRNNIRKRFYNWMLKNK